MRKRRSWAGEAYMQLVIAMLSPATLVTSIMSKKMGGTTSETMILTSCTTMGLVTSPDRSVVDMVMTFVLRDEALQISH